MSPRQRLEERIHTFSAPLGFGQQVQDLVKRVRSIRVGDAPAAVPYGDENRGQCVLEAYSVWSQQYDERHRLQAELHRIGARFNSYVSALHDVFFPDGLEHNWQKYQMHGDLDVCVLGGTMDKHDYVRAHAHFVEVPGVNAVRFGLQPTYAKSVKPLLSCLANMPGPRYAHKATFWALHPSQGTSDNNYLFKITMDKAEINPLGMPSGAEDKVVDGWQRFLKLAGYDNVIDIDTRRRSSAEVKTQEYSIARA